ncbi:MAG TPA: VOC family protein [Chloroflexia bacterium]|nr:VOC family protein [Chloroflexia bacterium]
MITQVGTVGVNVRDQAAARAFYTEQLGFALIRDEAMMPGTEWPRWIEVAPAGAPTHLVLFTPPDQESQIGTASRIVFHCDDIQATVQDLRARGIRFTTELEQQPWGWWAEFADLDGNGFGLWAPPH